MQSLFQKTRREFFGFNDLGLLLLCMAAAVLSGCSTTAGTHPKSAAPDYKFVESDNYNSRVSILVLHYTSGDFDSSYKVLTDSEYGQVSSHYLLPDPSDESYPHDKLDVYQLVPEGGRAWHAGKSHWRGKEALNDHSIGIEIVNQAYCVRSEQSKTVSGNSPVQRPSPQSFCFYPDFPESQIELLVPLIDDILKRHPRIGPTDIVGHSDIAPGRKVDPGPRFPWQRLYKLGYGAWFDDDVAIKYWNRFLDDPVPLTHVQEALKAYGYGIEVTGVMDQQTRNVIGAFQLHFRPSELTGEPSAETVAILFALIEKYRPEHLDALLAY